MTVEGSSDKETGRPETTKITVGSILETIVDHRITTEDANMSLREEAVAAATMMIGGDVTTIEGDAMMTKLAAIIAVRTAITAVVWIHLHDQATDGTIYLESPPLAVATTTLPAKGAKKERHPLPVHPIRPLPARMSEERKAARKVRRVKRAKRAKDERWIGLFYFTRVSITQN